MPGWRCSSDRAAVGDAACSSAACMRWRWSTRRAFRSNICADAQALHRRDARLRRRAAEQIDKRDYTMRWSPTSACSRPPTSISLKQRGIRASVRTHRAAGTLMARRVAAGHGHEDLAASSNYSRGASDYVYRYGSDGPGDGAGVGEAGHEVTVWNRTPSKAEGLGATVRPRRRALAGRCRVPEPDRLPGDVRSVRRPDRRSKVIINLSSDTPATTRRAAEWAGNRARR